MFFTYTYIICVYSWYYGRIVSIEGRTFVFHVSYLKVNQLRGRCDFVIQLESAVLPIIKSTDASGHRRTMW